MYGSPPSRLARICFSAVARIASLLPRYWTQPLARCLGVAMRRFASGAHCIRTLAALLTVLFGAVSANAQDTSALYDQPVLVIDPGMHTAPINRADVDKAGRFAVTGSSDKTVRIWQLVPKPELAGIIRIPSGSDDIGKIYSVAMSPDGALIAAGGWTTAGAPAHIYLFNRDGKLLKRMGGLPEVVHHLAFSADSRHLAAGLGRLGGIRVYDKWKEWGEVFRDAGYSDSVYGLEFSVDGRLATTSDDGRVRLYDADFRLTATHEPKSGHPFGIAFRPHAQQLAVGLLDTIGVALLDGKSLEPLEPFDVRGIDNGNVGVVAWSRDGSTLYAGGQFDVKGLTPTVAWNTGRSPQRRVLFSKASNTISSFKALPDGSLLVSATDPHLAIFRPDDAVQWEAPPPKFDPRGQWANFRVSVDGTAVEFGYEYGGKSRALFDLAKLKLAGDPFADGLTAPPRQTDLDIQAWRNSRMPTLAGKLLPLERNEGSQSLAIHPKGDHFVLGTNYYLRAFDAGGEQLWRRDVPGTAWAVNITGDGRIVVVAYGDGTIRWHRMDDGRELLAFYPVAYPIADRGNWVAWTPEGFYGATAGAHSMLKWHVNRGWDQAADAYPVSDFRYLRRPEALALVLQEMETARALGLDDIRKAAREVQQRTNSKLAPGALLHVVSVGVSDYGQNAAHLRLSFAQKDARDVISALINTQSGLYADVKSQEITDKEATREHVLAALQAMRENIAKRSGRGDLAVFHFSGHGALIRDRYFLLPHGVDARTADRISNTALSIDQLKAEFAEIGKHGRLLVLLDACRSGAMSSDGSALGVDGSQLKAALSGLANVTVLTSSNSAKPSFESKEWENGAFTKVFLGALGREADTNNDGLISVSELMAYMSEHLPRLTRDKGDQTPDMVVRFEGAMFVSGL